MIDKQILTQAAEQAIEGTNCFLVEVKCTADNRITVEIDSLEGVDIDTCVAISRRMEELLPDRDVEDYELEVGSAGLTSPLKVRQQYVKNIGNELEVLTKDGRKLTGVLDAVADDFSTFTLAVSKKVKLEGKKRPEIVVEPETIAVANTKTVKYLINFK